MRFFAIVRAILIWWALLTHRHDFMQNTQSQKNRSFWLKHLYRWHWISSAICLIGMLLFAATGLTLNNAGRIEGNAVVTKKQATVPALLLPQLRKQEAENAPLPKTLADWVAGALGVEVEQVAGEWSEDEVYVSMPRPGGDAWLVINRESGDLNYELTERGWVSYFNDLHKGRNTGLAWSWFLDVFSVMALVFSITGLCLLHMHAGNRPFTWPLVALGMVLPLLLVILFIH
ncbi:PepSY-associated TM helix domain-containing protein [Methylobacillus caricis]|uniref:PepSY-associated TM helix domain-containing protein n=1 Tax=Methylobacillus caricis TaxID=1971611 RepID=UPI001CFF692C|nr:PepSY-associated TM helix domain-containing protein [Methylobacillus caricis]MCB5186526.1 PepSY-associated TM helix domain-containing protein [Methylobacillus caricis]